MRTTPAGVALARRHPRPIMAPMSYVTWDEVPPSASASASASIAGLCRKIWWPIAVFADVKTARATPTFISALVHCWHGCASSKHSPVELSCIGFNFSWAESQCCTVTSSHI